MAKLCAEKEVLAPGKKGKLTYVSCAPKRGLFRLGLATLLRWLSKKMPSSFVEGMDPTVGGERFTFYTDI